MTAKEQVIAVYPDAEVVQVRGLKLYIIEARNTIGRLKGLGYGTTPTAAWESALQNIKNETNYTTHGLGVS